MNPPGGEDSEANSLYPIKQILSAIPTNTLLMLITTHSSKYNLDALTKTSRFVFHSDFITTLQHDREAPFTVALPHTTTQLDGDLYALADAMQFLSTNAPLLPNLDRVVITSHEPRTLNLITDTSPHNGQIFSINFISSFTRFNTFHPLTRVELHWVPRKPSGQRFLLLNKIFSSLKSSVENLQLNAPPHSLPFTHSLDYVITTHEIERERTWQQLYENSHLSRLVRAILPTVSLKPHPFWKTLRLPWKHQEDPDRELGSEWEERERLLSKLAGDRATTTRVAHVILDQGYFGSFRQRFNLDGEILCPTCQVIETTNHVILDCPRFEVARHHITRIETQFNHLFPRNPRQITLLHWLGSSAGIVALAHFLARCNALKAPVTLRPPTEAPHYPAPMPPPPNPGRDPPPPHPP